MPISNKYVLLKEQILSTVATPLKSTHRIKYTCFEISQHLLIFGATSGGIYIFQRDPCSFIQLIPSKEGAVTKVSMSNDERFIAFSTNRGVACVFEWDDDTGAKLINRSLEHNGTVITELVWGDSSNQLYVGDSQGRLSVINVSLFLSNNIFQLPAFIFMQLESGIVQVSCFENYLLVSTETWCYICDTAREQYKQIGSKLREGHYGACFFKKSSTINIYCGRPGSRLWEVDINGTVQRTHQFKKALATAPAQLILLEDNTLEISKIANWPEQAFNFCYLTVAMGKYLFTFKEDGIYLFDPVEVKVVLWSNHYKGIMSAKCINNIIYLWTANGELHSLVLSAVDKCLINLFFQEQYTLCGQLFSIFLDDITSSDYFSLSPLTDLVDFLDGSKNDNERLRKCLEEIKNHVKERQLATKLDSGIFLVENRHWKKWRFPQAKNGTKFKNRYLSRSRSLPPDPVCSNKASSQFDMHPTVSMPNIHISLDYIDNTTNGFSSPTLKYHNPLDSRSFLQLPFLSHTSPDILHNTILELGNNMSNPSLNGVCGMNNKWQVSEGKFKLLNNDANRNDLDMNSVKNHETNHHNHINNSHDIDSEELVVRQKPSDHSKASAKYHKIDCHEIIKMIEVLAANEIPNSNLLFNLFDAILSKYLEYNDTHLKKGRKKCFPFRKLISSDNVAVIQKLFHNVISSGEIVEYLTNLKQEYSSHFDFPKHPHLLVTIFNESDLNLDLLFTNFLTIFADIIDPFTIFQSFESCSLRCFFMSWCVILDIFQDSAFNYITDNDETTSVVYGEWPLPLLLNTLFLMFRLQQVESSCHMFTGRNLKLYHISYLILKLSLHLVSTGVSIAESDRNCNELLLKYISKLVDKNILDFSYLNDFLVLKHLEIAFLKVNMAQEPICVCGYSLAGKKHDEVKFSNVGRLLVKLHMSKFQSSDWSELCRMNESFELKMSNNSWQSFLMPSGNKESPPIPFRFDVSDLMPEWDNNSPIFIPEYEPLVRLVRIMPELIYTIIIQTANNFMECIPFIIQFNVIKHLDQFICKAPKRFCEMMCEMNFTFSQGRCCICSNESAASIDVDWNDLSAMVLKSLGANHAIALLLKYAKYIPPEEINITFFRAALLSNMVQNRSSDVHTAVVGAYLNQISNSTSKELSQESELLTMENSQLCTPYVIDGKESNNWGIKLDFSIDVCSRCALSLNSEQLLKDGLRAFKCGHIYHVTCLHLTKCLFKCPLCSSQKYDLLS